MYIEAAINLNNLHITMQMRSFFIGGGFIAYFVKAFERGFVQELF